MPPLHGHGTLVVAQYTSEGIAVASDSLQKNGGIDGITVCKSEVRKLFRVDSRTVCALSDLSSYKESEGKRIDFSETVERGAFFVRELQRRLSFENKCELIASALNELLQELPDAVAAYPKKTVSTLLFFGYQGRGARFGFCEFVHEIEDKNVDSKRGDRIVAGPELWVFGPSKTIEARMGADFQKAGGALVYSIRDSTLNDAAIFVDSLISTSIEEMPEDLEGRVQIETIPRNLRMEPALQ